MDELPLHAVLRIISKVPLDEAGASEFWRVDAPLVCKTWARLALEPVLWRTVVADLRSQDSLNVERAQAWLAARAGCIQRLALMLPEEHASFAADAVATLSEQPGLSHFCLDIGGADARLGKLLKSLPAQLETLCLTKLQDGVNKGMLLLGRLRSLKSLTLHFAKPGRRKLANFPLSLAPCNQLEELVLTNADFHLDSDAVAASLPETFLPRLRCLCLLDTITGGIPPAGFRTVTSLQDVRVMGMGVMGIQYEPGPMLLDAFHRLATVELTTWTWPETLFSLPALKHLALHELWIDAGDGEATTAAEKNECFWELLYCVSLETLALRGCRLGFVPEAVKEHTALRSLTLRGCVLSGLPDGPYLTHLQRLDLRDNCLTSAPLAALQAPCLQALQLDDEAPLVLPSHETRDEAFAAQLSALEARLAARWGSAPWSRKLAELAMSRCCERGARQHLASLAQAAAHGTPAGLPPPALDAFAAKVFLPLAVPGQVSKSSDEDDF